MEYKPFGPLAEKTLLGIGSRLLVATDDEVHTSFWAKIKRMGLKSLCVILHKSEVNRFWCEKMKALGIIDEFNVDGLIHEKEDCRTVEEIGDGIIKWLKDQNINANGVYVLGDFSAVVGSYVCEKLGIPVDSYESTMACFLKDLTQEYVLKAPKAAKYGVPSYSVNSKKELQATLTKLTFPVVMKPLCGSGSVGCQVHYDVTSCLQFFSELTTGMLCGTAGLDKLSYTQSVLVMEYLKGDKYSVDVVISRGKRVGGFVVRRGPPPLPEFWNTSVIIPGGDSDKVDEELVEASYQCCRAVGLRQGVYNVELIRVNGNETPRLIEINPRPAGNMLVILHQEAYANDTQVIHGKLCCNTELSFGEMKIEPKRHVAAYYFDLVRRKDKLKTAYGHMLSNAKEYDVKMLNVGIKTTTEMMYENSKAVRPVLIVMTSAESRCEAINKLSRFLVDSKYFDCMEEALLYF